MSIDRRRLFTRGALSVAGALALLLVYGVAVEPRLILDERLVTAEIPALDASWEGEQVAVFSDLQIGMWLSNEGMVERVVERTVEAEPAAVLLAGDFVYSRSPDVRAQADGVVELLQPILDAQIPVLAVMGNHDYAVDAVDDLTAAFQEAGMEVLRNASAVVPHPARGGAPLHVVGLGPEVPDVSDVDRALADVPATAPRIVLMHNPTTFAEMPAGSAPFAVAGHTHCGQIALPGTPRWSYVGLTEEEELVAEGWAPQGYGAAGNALYVTCGIGFSLVPVRINAPPQLVLVDLVPSD